MPRELIAAKGAVSAGGGRNEWRKGSVAPRARTSAFP